MLTKNVDHVSFFHSIFLRLFYLLKSLSIIIRNISKILLFFLAGPTDPPGCTSDEECASTEVCRNRQCLNPCEVLNPCAPNAECQVSTKIIMYYIYKSPNDYHCVLIYLFLLIYIVYFTGN